MSIVVIFLILINCVNLIFVVNFFIIEFRLFILLRRAVRFRDLGRSDGGLALLSLLPLLLRLRDFSSDWLHHLTNHRTLSLRVRPRSLSGGHTRHDLVALFPSLSLSLSEFFLLLSNWHSHLGSRVVLSSAWELERGQLRLLLRVALGNSGTILSHRHVRLSLLLELCLGLRLRLHHV